MDQNDDEMILVVIGDEDGIVKYEISKSQPAKLVPISAKIESIENAKDCTEDEDSEVQQDVEVLNEEYLSQEDCLEKFIENNIVTKTIESNVPRKKTARKTRHKVLVDEADYPKQSYPSSKNIKRKTNVPPTKLARKKESIPDEDFYEIEFLEDEFDFPEKAPNKTPVSDEDFNEIEFLDVSSTKIKNNKNIAPKEHTLKKTPISDKESLETKYLDGDSNIRKKEVPLKKHPLKMEDEEYLSEEEDQKEEYVSPKKINRKTNIPSKKPTKKTSRKPAQKDSEKPKTEERHINSFIAELYKKQPLYKENKEELVEYLANLMRKRRPPPPLPNSYLLTDDNEYSCSYCDVDSPTEATARRHYQHSHGPRYLVCYACGDDFRSTANLYKHEKRCRAPDAEIQLRARGVFLGCKVRGRPYLTDNKFIPMKPARRKTNPVPIVEAEKTKFYCPQCPAVYERSSSFKEHMHKHTGFRPFQCNECPASYVSRNQLHRHVKKHGNEQFICDHCGKVHKLKSYLVAHMDTHLPRLRYGCGRCGRRYAKRGEVRSHILRDHMNMPPPAACPVCPKRYNRMSHVKAHMKTDHGLILMTKNAIIRNLPYLKVQDLEGAKIVFNTNENTTKLVKLNPEEEILTKITK